MLEADHFCKRCDGLRGHPVEQMSPDRSRLNDMAPVGAGPAGVKVGGAQSQRSGCAVQHCAGNPTGAVSGHRIMHVIGHAVANIGKRASPATRRMKSRKFNMAR